MNHPLFIRASGMDVLVKKNHQQITTNQQMRKLFRIELPFNVFAFEFRYLSVKQTLASTLKSRRKLPYDTLHAVEAAGNREENIFMVFFHENLSSVCSNIKFTALHYLLLAGN
jgi:hypothetical protein